MDDLIATVLAIIIFLGIGFGIMLGMWGLRLSSVGHGEHSGFITAVDQKGYIFKNYDVYFKTDNSSSQEDTYCINRNNPVLVSQALEANRKRKQVTVEYEGVKGIGFDLCYGSEIKAIK